MVTLNLGLVRAERREFYMQIDAELNETRQIILKIDRSITGPQILERMEKGLIIKGARGTALHKSLEQML